MSKLMKYEFRKTLATKLILLGITAVAEIAFLLGLYLEKTRLLATSVAILTLLAIGGILMIGLGSILIFHRDINTKQSYMLFMTPNSCYKILGAKVIENGLSILLGGAFFFTLGAIDIALLFAKEGNIQEMWKWIEDLIHSINKNIQLDAKGLACVTFGLLSSWIATVTTAYLAEAVSAALLNGKKYNGVLSFALFLVITILLSWLGQKATQAIVSVNLGFLIQGGIFLLASGLMYVATAQTMERKLSV
ncbi:MAG: hypothetical protein IJ189_11875 [Clostridia bacterium]|nr:hypothetical protein [Clostridia bacterium]